MDDEWCHHRLEQPRPAEPGAQPRGQRDRAPPRLQRRAARAHAAPDGRALHARSRPKGIRRTPAGACWSAPSSSTSCAAFRAGRSCCRRTGRGSSRSCSRPGAGRAAASDGPEPMSRAGTHPTELRPHACRARRHGPRGGPGRCAILTFAFFALVAVVLARLARTLDWDTVLATLRGYRASTLALAGGLRRLQLLHLRRHSSWWRAATAAMRCRRRSPAWSARSRTRST